MARRLRGGFDELVRSLQGGLRGDEDVLMRLRRVWKAVFWNAVGINVVSSDDCAMTLLFPHLTL